MFEQFLKSSPAEIVAMVSLFLGSLSAVSSVVVAFMNNRHSRKMRELDIRAGGQRFLLDSLFQKKHAAYNNLMIELGKYVASKDSESVCIEGLLVAIDSAFIVASSGVQKDLESMRNCLKESPFLTEKSFKLVDDLSQSMSYDLVNVARDYDRLLYEKERYIDHVK